MQVTVIITDDQAKAIDQLQLMDLQDLCNKAVANAIRGKFKYYSEKAENDAGSSYDWATTHGAKFDVDRREFVSMYMHEIRETLSRL